MMPRFGDASDLDITQSTSNIPLGVVGNDDKVDELDKVSTRYIMGGKVLFLAKI